MNKRANLEVKTFNEDNHQVKPSIEGKKTLEV